MIMSDQVKPNMQIVDSVHKPPSIYSRREGAYEAAKLLP